MRLTRLAKKASFDETVFSDDELIGLFAMVQRWKDYQAPPGQTRPPSIFSTLEKEGQAMTADLVARRKELKRVNQPDPAG